MKYQNSFILKAVLIPEYKTLFDQHGFHMQGLYRIFVFIALALPKESDLHLDPPLLPVHDRCRRYKLNDWMVINTYSYPFQE